MSFKKIVPELIEGMEMKGFDSLRPIQKTVLSKIKGGSSLFVLGETGTGKTTAMIVSIIQKLEGVPGEDSPRAIILVENKDKALALEEEFRLYIRPTDLRLVTVYDGKDIRHQIDAIYVGVDIVIATVQRLSKIYFQNGIHLGELKVLAVDDMEFMKKGSILVDVVRISESLKKCQYLLCAQKMDPRFERLRDSFMARSEVVM